MRIKIWKYINVDEVSQKTDNLIGTSLPYAKQTQEDLRQVSHVHMIFARHGPQQIEHVIRDIKKFTSFKIIEGIRHNPHESRRELLLWLF